MSGSHRKLLLSLSAAALLAALTFTTAGPALAAPAVSVKSTEASARSAAAKTVLPARLRAFYWARTQYGKPYVWGGTGPGLWPARTVLLPPTPPTCPSRAPPRTENPGVARRASATSNRYGPPRFHRAGLRHAACIQRPASPSGKLSPSRQYRT